MAAAGAAALDINMALEGLGDVVQDIRTAAGQFENLRGSVDSANDAVGQLRAQLTSGAGAGQFGGLAAQFRSIGIAAEQIPDVAANFRERLFRDPIAIGAFGRSVLPSRLGGPQDETRELREAMRMLRETTSAEERLYTARRLGLETLLPLADADERHYQALEEEGATRGALVDEELRQLRANHTANAERLADLREERDLVQERIALRFGNWWRDNITLPIDEFLTHGLEALAFRLGLGPAPGTASGGMQSHTDALQQNTRALANLREEFANGGRRSRAAVPEGLRGVSLQKALESGKLQIGAFIP